MKRTFYLLLLYLLSFAAIAQDNSHKPRSANGAYLGIYGYGCIPLFKLARANYAPGYGFSLAYLSRTFTLSEPKQITWRAGAAFGISGHGSKSFPVVFDDSLHTPGKQSFGSNYFSLDARIRCTFERNKTLKPYGELFLGLGTFSSYEKYSLNGYVKAGPDGNYSKGIFIFGLAGGCMTRLSNAFWIDTRIAFTQGASSVTFSDPDLFNFNGTLYQHTERTAVPSLLTIQLGLVFRIPYIPFQMSSPEYEQSEKYNNPAPQKQERQYKTLPPRTSD